jgi:hypothetical protein
VHRQFLSNVFNDSDCSDETGDPASNATIDRIDPTVHSPCIVHVETQDTISSNVQNVPSLERCFRHFPIKSGMQLETGPSSNGSDLQINIV